ncbi:PAS domain S-box protein [uncultured Desulfobacterium sp.]|uniref:histidine kinase n=1 Tax=uncultured Desulfobacterium sp. TaxID=201089 RepID=A0A445N3X9_9BACT|nr:PAS domain S-box protein [uncultured Desulfobacterium sp.]
MISEYLWKIKGISLLFKLLIPLLFLTFVLSATMAYIGLTSQQNMIKNEERKEIRNFYYLFVEKMEYTKRRALSLASVIAENPKAQALLANRDREELKKQMLPLFEKLKKDSEISQFHFHTPDIRSFLRLHLPEEYGESLAYRKTIVDAVNQRHGVAGLERGIAGLGIRGVSPVFYKGLLIGTIEIGYPFGQEFLQDLKVKWGPDFTVYEKNGDNTYHCLATTLNFCDELRLIHYLKDSGADEPTVIIAPDNYPQKSFTLGPIRDYNGNVVALVKIEKNRSAIMDRLNHTRNLMVLDGLSGIVVSFIVIWTVSSQVTRPIRQIVKFAQEIAEDKREIHLDPRPEDEIGVLTRSLNSMLESLTQRRRQIEDYAKTLEKKVAERTYDLVISEEKYRTLIEHLPLIVYRLLEDGSVEFINPYFAKKLGYTVEEAVSDRTFWWKMIYGKDHGDRDSFLSTFAEDGKEYRAERVVKDKSGNILTFIDRMIPMRDEAGNIKWIDGIMVDITELKRLQERAMQTEEIKLLGEISARFAHEIRNPLVTVGGFARRLQDSLPKDDKKHDIAGIIVAEVARLEQILRIMLSSIRPFTLYMSAFDCNNILRSLISEYSSIISQRQIDLEQSLSPDLPKIACDENMLHRAFKSLIVHAILSMPEKGRFLLSTSSENDHVVVIMKYREHGLSDEDLEQFFFPRFTNKVDKAGEDMPLSKVIIHRHGGKIDISAEEEDIVVIRVELPIKQSD